MITTGQAIAIMFITSDATGKAVAADSTPTGKLVVNDTDNAATVTIGGGTNGLYTASVTLPTLAVGDIVQLRINATISTIAAAAIVWTDYCDVNVTTRSTLTQTQVSGYAGPILTDNATGLVSANATKIGGTTQTGGDVGLMAKTLVYSVVLAASSPTSTVFQGDSSTSPLSTTNDFYNDCYVVFVTGALAGSPARRISAYVGATRQITLYNALPTAPAAGNGFVILGGTK